MKGFALIALSVAFAGAANASVVYTYTGHQFDSLAYASGNTQYDGENFFTTNDFLSVQLTLSDLLPAFSTLSFNQTLVPTFNSQIGPSPVTPLSWQISAGPLSYSSASRLFVSLATDGAGNISQWNILMHEYLPSFPSGDGTLFGGVDTVLDTRSSQPGFAQDFAASCRGNSECLGSFGYPAGSVGAWEPHAAGTWTITNTTSVPAPATALLLCTGLIGLLVTRRRGHTE